MVEEAKDVTGADEESGLEVELEDIIVTATERVLLEDGTNSRLESGVEAALETGNEDVSEKTNSPLGNGVEEVAIVTESEDFTATAAKRTGRDDDRR
jgi:hypothetical protein